MASMRDGLRRDLGLVWRQFRYHNTLFWRSPVAAFFTLAFPLMLLLVFSVVFPNDPIGDTGLTIAQFYAPALGVFGAVSATYTSLAMTTTIARDEGILKRVRGTPLPPWVYMAGRVLSSVYIAAIAVVVMLLAGVVLKDLQIVGAAVPSLVLTFFVGVACFAALGLLIAALSPTSESTSVIANATLLPLAFISDIFIVTDGGSPGWVRTVADLFPLRHFAVAFVDGFKPAVIGGASTWLDFIHWGDLAVMAVWFVGGVLLAMRLFTWEPRGAERRGRRRRRAAAT
jgi:ABC-2 type transport system permease protein